MNGPRKEWSRDQLEAKEWKKDLFWFLGGILVLGLFFYGMNWVLG